MREPPGAPRHRLPETVEVPSELHQAAQTPPRALWLPQRQYHTQRNPGLRDHKYHNPWLGEKAGYCERNRVQLTGIKSLRTGKKDASPLTANNKETEESRHLALTSKEAESGVQTTTTTISILMVEMHEKIT